MKYYQKKECEDCSTAIEIEVLQTLLDDLRLILQVPEKEDIKKYTEKLMKKHKKKGLKEFF